MDPDPTPFFNDLRDAKKLNYFHIFFSYNLPTGTLSSVLKIKIFCKIFILQALFQSAQHTNEKREGSKAGFGAGSGSVHLTNGSVSWRPKNMRILRIRIPNTDGNNFEQYVPVMTNFKTKFTFEN